MVNLLYFMIIMITMFLGEWVSKKTHSWIPSIFITAIIFLIGFWTIFPKDLITKASYTKDFITITIGLFLVHLGTVMNIKKLLKQMKALASKQSLRKDPDTAKAMVAEDTSSSSTNNWQHYFSLGEKYDTPAFIIAKVAAIAVFSFWVGNLLNGVINSNVLLLVLGDIARAIGFLPSNALNKAGVFNWLMYGLLTFILAELNATTPSTIGKILLQVLVLIALGLSGMFLASVLLAKPFGMSRSMAFACALTALCGFPADYILTNDVVNSLTNDSDEQQFLLDNMLPKMLVGGFATVSIASVLIASFFLNML